MCRCNQGTEFVSDVCLWTFLFQLCTGHLEIGRGSGTAAVEHISAMIACYIILFLGMSRFPQSTRAANGEVFKLSHWDILRKSCSAKVQVGTKRPGWTRTCPSSATSWCHRWALMDSRKLSRNMIGRFQCVSAVADKVPSWGSAVVFPHGLNAPGNENTQTKSETCQPWRKTDSKTEG